jgi:hypothetical protein
VSGLARDASCAALEALPLSLAGLVATLRLDKVDGEVSVDVAVPVRDTRLAGRSTLNLDGVFDGEA